MIKASLDLPDVTTAWTVAIVDDHADAKELISYAIRTVFPHALVRNYESPRALLENLLVEQPTAIITRQKLLGEMDGLSLCRTLRANGFTGPILMITNADEIATEAKGAGADEFLTFDRWSEVPMRLANLLVHRSSLK